MKKIIISLLLAVSLLFCGCSCTPETSLGFTSAWNGGDEPSIGFSEKCVYKVEYVADFNEDGLNYTVDEQVGEVLEFEYANGVYTTELKVLPTTADIKNKESDILTADVGHVIYLKTTFNITSRFKYGDATEYEEYNDSIVTEVYFCPVGASYTPIYSKTIASYASVQVLEVPTVEKIEYEKEFYYNTETYSFDGEEYEKTFKTYIDNGQLLFALRNINIEEEGSFALPTTSIQYGVPKTLSVSRISDRALNLSAVNVNGEDIINPAPATKRFTFRLNTTLNAGKEQLVYVNNASDFASSRAVIVRYVAPLGETGSFLNLGAMQYTLTEYTFS